MIPTKKKFSKLYNDQKKTLQEIGDLYGLSRQRIAQLMECWGLPRNTQRARASGVQFQYKKAKRLLNGNRRKHT